MLTAVVTAQDWGPVLFATLVPVAVLILGGLLHVVYRTGRLTTEVEHLRSDIQAMWQQGHLAIERKVQHHE